MRSSVKILSFLAVMVITGLIACSSGESRLTGVWIVEDVSIDADTAKISGEQIGNAIKTAKAVHFEFFDDKTMNIITDAGTFPGNWSLNEKSNEIFVRLSGSTFNDSIKIGEYTSGKIISKDKTEAGWVKVVYVKE